MRIIFSSFLTLFLLLTATALQAITLTIEDGSAWYCECAPYFFVENPIQAGPDGGIILGIIQTASGSHTNEPDGTESPGIDNPWTFFGNTGMHLTTSPVTTLSSSANVISLDFSGWGLTWNGHSFISLGQGAWTGYQDGVATVTCAVDCSNGDNYQLDYTATIPSQDPSGFGGVRYRLELHGTISAVPVPAALWLFVSGLVIVTGAGIRKNISYTYKRA